MSILSTNPAMENEDSTEEITDSSNSDSPQIDRLLNIFQKLCVNDSPSIDITDEDMEEFTYLAEQCDQYDKALKDYQNGTHEWLRNINETHLRLQEALLNAAFRNAEIDRESFDILRQIVTLFSSDLVPLEMRLPKTDCPKFISAMSLPNYASIQYDIDAISDMISPDEKLPMDFIVQWGRYCWEHALQENGIEENIAYLQTRCLEGAADDYDMEMINVLDEFCENQKKRSRDEDASSETDTEADVAQSPIVGSVDDVEGVDDLENVKAAAEVIRDKKNYTSDGKKAKLMPLSETLSAYVILDE